MNRYLETAMSRRRLPLRLAAAIAMFAAIGALAACSKADQPPPGPPQGPPPVSVAPALEKEIVESEEFSGRIEAVEQVEVRARVNGYIQSVTFKQGQDVKKGDSLYQIDPRPFQAAVMGEEAALATIRAQQELAKTELARAELMWEDRATSKREYDEKASRVRELQAQARAAQAALERARLNLSYTRIVAPIAGRVSKPEITAGNLVQGEVPNSPVLTTIVSSNPIYAAFEADERTYLQYGLKSRGKAALPVHVGLATEDGFPHEGRLDFVDNRVDPATGTVKMRAVLENPDGLLTPGLFARIKLSDSTRTTPAVLVSDRAIGTDQDKKFVFVVNGENKAQYRQVKLGPIIDGLRVVRDGLKPGELVVVNGLQRVRPGAPVTPEQVPMEAEQKTPTASRLHQTASVEAPRAN